MKQIPRKLLKISLLLNLPISLLLVIFFAIVIHTQTKLNQNLNSIQQTLVDIEIITSKQQTTPTNDSLNDTVQDLRTDIAQLKQIQRSDNITDQLTGKIAGITQDSSQMYPHGIQGYVALDTNQFTTADVLEDRTNQGSKITTITDDTPMPFSFKANGWYLVSLNDSQGWIKSLYVQDVTAQVVSDHE